MLRRPLLLHFVGGAHLRKCALSYIQHRRASVFAVRANTHVDRGRCFGQRPPRRTKRASRLSSLSLAATPHNKDVCVCVSGRPGFASWRGCACQVDALVGIVLWSRGPSVQRVRLDAQSVVGPRSSGEQSFCHTHTRTTASISDLSCQPGGHPMALSGFVRQSMQRSGFTRR